MSDALDRLNSLRAKTTELGRQQAKAAADLDNANQRLREHVDVLKHEFGCSDLTEARTKLDEMETELTRMIADIEKSLDVLA